LVKNAFRAIADSEEFNGTEDNHKLVSDAFDVAQLFFEFDQVRNCYPNAEIIAWDQNADIEDARNNRATKVFGESMRLFWQQDASSYNFDKTNHIFILRINHQVIGATSPATLFFASPEAEKSNLNFSIGNVQLFDANYEAIFDRDSDFIEFFYALYKQPSFASLFPEVYHYLLKAIPTIQAQNPELWDTIMGYNSNSLNNFTPLSLTGIPNISICGLPVCKNVLNPRVVETNSDFTIQASGKINGLDYKPLVLPVDKFFEPWTYVKPGSKWDPITKVPEDDPASLSQRILPGQAVRYPYLTINDFFEEKIIKLPYKINSGSISDCNFEEFLLPLKPLFFELFNIDDLILQNMISIDTTIHRAVRVTLTIPTSNGNLPITYHKLYREDSINELNFHLGLFPLLDASALNIPIEYHIGLVDDDDSISKLISLQFWNGCTKLTDVNSAVRKEKVEGLASVSYKCNTCFDKIQITASIGSQHVNGFLIPKFKKFQPNATKAKVAFDFGTTNTHIEIKYDQATEKAFEANDLYAALSFEVNKADHILADLLLNMEIFPKSISNEGICNFPLRTALLTNKNINWSANPAIFQDSNIAFYYEKAGTQSHHAILTDLKWRNLSNSEEEEKLSHFIEGTLEGIKYKLLSDGIQPSNVEIRWLYPVSMSINQKYQLASIWANVVDKLFGKDTSLIDLPESIAPFEYYAKNMGLMGLTASIDIGGGSSDISIFNQEDPKMISSVSFAGNAIVGDGYNSNLRINGFYRLFKDKFFENCDLNNGSEQKVILNQIINGINPSSSNFFCTSTKDFFPRFLTFIISSSDL
jgi:hypothetical protein